MEAEDMSDCRTGIPFKLNRVFFDDNSWQIEVQGSAPAAQWGSFPEELTFGTEVSLEGDFGQAKGVIAAVDWQFMPDGLHCTLTLRRVLGWAGLPERIQA